MITQMQVKGLMFDPYNNAYIVVLRDEDEAEMLPIWVGKSEASAISLALEHVAPPRPMTHDLMGDIVSVLGGRIFAVEIQSLVGSTYYGAIRLVSPKIGRAHV